jgi:hypothetical protein
VAATQCAEPTGPTPPIAHEFGKVTALVNSRPWQSSYFPDSLIASYDIATGRIQVFAQERRAGVRPTVLLVVPSAATIGGYHLTNDSGGLFAIWVAGSHQTYTSSGFDGDSLWIEELDVATGTIRGSVRFVGLPVFADRSQFVVEFIGKFAGAMRLGSSQ